MATPLKLEAINASPTPKETKPETVLGAKFVQLALITYIDDTGHKTTQLGIVGDNTVHMLDGNQLGLSRERQHVGEAKNWLKNGIFKLLGK